MSAIVVAATVVRVAPEGFEAPYGLLVVEADGVRSLRRYDGPPERMPAAGDRLDDEPAPGARTRRP